MADTNDETVRLTPPNVVFIVPRAVTEGVGEHLVGDGRSCEPRPRRHGDARFGRR
jgi:hypothetical protein